MSKEVKRYDPFGYDGLSALMHEDADGGWVRVENYEALRLELAEANADFVRIANERDALLAERDAYRKALEKLATVPGCGCSFPCRCDGEEWTRAELEGRMDYAAETLARAALKGEQP